MKARGAGLRPEGLTRNRLVRLLAPAGRRLWRRPNSLCELVEQRFFPGWAHDTNEKARTGRALSFVWRARKDSNLLSPGS